MQEVIVLLVFLSALFYLGRIGYRSFFSKTEAGCTKGCGSCSAVDITKIEAEIKRKKLSE